MSQPHGGPFLCPFFPRGLVNAVRMLRTLWGGWEVMLCALCKHGGRCEEQRLDPGECTEPRFWGNLIPRGSRALPFL